MGEYILFSTIVIFGTSIFGFIYDIYISIKEDKLRDKNVILVKWPKIMAIIIAIIFWFLCILLILGTITEDGLFVIILAISLFFVLLLPLVFLFLYFCRHRYNFNFESKKLTVYYVLKKKKTYSFDEIKEIVDFPQTLNIYLLNN